MSTKTTFKRVALVTVAALGFGVLTTLAPASAAARGLSVDVPSVTVVGVNKSGVALTGGAAIYKLSVTDQAGDAANLVSGESITAVVSGLPAAAGGYTPATSDLRFLEVNTRTTGVLDTSTVGGLLTTDAAITHLNQNCVTPNDNATSNTGNYCFLVEGLAGKALDDGTYTITFYLNDSNGNQRAVATSKYTAVSTAATSGAVLAAAAVGRPSAGLAWTSSTTSYLRATLTDANGGRIVLSDTSSTSSIQPKLSATLENSTGATVYNTLSAQDTYTSTAWTSDYGSATTSAANDGVYLLTPQGVISSSLPTTAASYVRVIFGVATASATISGIAAGGSLPSASTRSVSGTGLYTATDTTTANGAISYAVPLTTTSITVKITTKSASATLVNEPLTFTPTWTNANAGDIAPKSATPAVYFSDASGVVTYTITQNNPIAGSKVVVGVTGEASGAGTYGSLTFTWGVPTLTSISMSPSSDFKVVAAGSATWTVTARDQFFKPMAGIVLQPSLSSTSSSYSSTAMAVVTTGADGKASVTLTAGAADTFNSLTFTDNVTGVASSARKATAVTTLPVISTLTGYYGTNESLTPSTPFSATAIGSTAALTTVGTQDYTRTLAVTGTSTTDAINQFQVTALDSAGAVVSGVPVVITASAGSYFTDSCTGATGLLVTSKTCYPNTTTGNINIVGISTKTGTATFTFTAGTVVATQTVNVGNATTDARFVTITGDSTAAAGANSLPNLKAAVTDRFGNPVANVSVQLSVSGAGALGGGAKIGSFTTDTAGEINFNLQSNVDGATTVTAYQTTANDSTSTAGKSLSATVDSTVAAGTRSATFAFTWSAGASAVDQAQAATDAAAEATDAANAATDAANAAAEAADAATAAAQDAADAVAALSTQVSEMIDALKKQITALTNLVIKIQKKVKA